MINKVRFRRNRIRSNDTQTDAKSPITAEEVAKTTVLGDEPTDDAHPDILTPTARGQSKAARWIQRSLRPILIGVPAALVAASVALASCMYIFQSRPDHQIGRAAENAALTAATTGSIAVLSYSPDSLDRDLASARSHLTGDFLTYFTQFADQVVAPAAKQKSVKTTAQVTKAAVSQMHSAVAVALLFINQTTVSADHPEPWVTTSCVLVTVNNVKGKWLIAKFEPV